MLTPLYGGNPKPGAETLGRWVGGKWSGEGSMVNTEFSKAMTVSGVTTCAWSPDHVFVICDQAVKANDKPGRQLSLYGYDLDAASFTSTASLRQKPRRARPSWRSAATAIAGSTSIPRTSRGRLFAFAR